MHFLLAFVVASISTIALADQSNGLINLTHLQGKKGVGTYSVGFFTGSVAQNEKCRITQQEDGRIVALIHSTANKRNYSLEFNSYKLPVKQSTYGKSMVYSYDHEDETHICSNGESSIEQTSLMVDPDGFTFAIIPTCNFPERIDCHQMK